MLSGIGASYSIAGLTVQVRPSRGEAAPAPSMDVTRDLTDLLLTLGEAARQHERGVVLLFDELQFAATDPLGALVTALHKVAQRELPVTMVAAGLPQTRGVLAEAASYSERMFALAEVGPLTGGDARRALVEPAEQEGVSWSSEALDEVVRFTEGYPYFLQLFGDLLWQHATSEPLSARDVARTAPLVRSALDNRFFPRTERLPVAQRRYLRAMAESGAAEVASRDVAELLGLRSSTQAGQTRDALIRKGLIYSPRLGYASFTVPQFDDHLRRHHELERHEPQPRPGR